MIRVLMVVALLYLNIQDVGPMASYWRQTVQPPPTVDAGRRYDLNTDGVINGLDSSILAKHFNQTCP